MDAVFSFLFGTRTGFAILFAGDEEGSFWD